jgi:hypothetical protein
VGIIDDFIGAGRRHDSPRLSSRPFADAVVAALSTLRTDILNDLFSRLSTPLFIRTSIFRLIKCQRLSPRSKAIRVC